MTVRFATVALPFALALTACTSSPDAPANPDATAPIVDAGAPADDTAPADAYSYLAPDRGIRATLSGARLNVECGATSCKFGGQIATFALRGKPTETYTLTLRVRGIVEQKTITGGKNDGGFWSDGGAPANDNHNAYSLEISSPKRTIYLNRGDSKISYVVPIDYRLLNVSVRGDASVVLRASDGGDERALLNKGRDGKPVKIPGIPPFPSAHSGQFVQLDIDQVR